jgi:hypothetical protein
MKPYEYHRFQLMAESENERKMWTEAMQAAAITLGVGAALKWHASIACTVAVLGLCCVANTR